MALPWLIGAAVVGLGAAMMNKRNSSYDQEDELNYENSRRKAEADEKARLEEEQRQAEKETQRKRFAKAELQALIERYTLTEKTQLSLRHMAREITQSEESRAKTQRTLEKAFSKNHAAKQEMRVLNEEKLRALKLLAQLKEEQDAK